MKWHNKFIPTKYYKNIFDIDYKKFKEQGIKALFFDLDNTIISYDIDVIEPPVVDFLEKLNEEFKVIVVSNSKNKRVSTATVNLKTIPFVKFARKPLKFGFKKALKIASVDASEVAIFGDQIMTDIYGGNRMKFKEVCLIEPIKKKSDHLSTRINRKIEKRILKRIKKKNLDKYNEVLKEYAE